MLYHNIRKVKFNKIFLQISQALPFQNHALRVNSPILQAKEVVCLVLLVTIVWKTQQIFLNFYAHQVNPKHTVL